MKSAWKSVVDFFVDHNYNDIIIDQFYMLAPCIVSLFREKSVLKQAGYEDSGEGIRLMDL